VTFTVPAGERHFQAVFEALTGYMPAEFSRFLTFEPARGLQPLSDGPGEQHLPVVLATPDGAYAMGVYSPDQPAAGFPESGYGRFRFPDEKVVKMTAQRAMVMTLMRGSTTLRRCGAVLGAK
jgi:hypothetical protein